MKTYQEKLLDPRWQKIRLEIFERDGWKCRICRSESETLHVHHTYYEPGKEPWDYHSSLVTLCSSCHEAEPSIRSGYLLMLKKALDAEGFVSDDIYTLTTFVLNIAQARKPSESLGDFLNNLVSPWLEVQK